MKVDDIKPTRIKLRGNTNTNTDGFMRDFYKHTGEGPGRHHRTYQGVGIDARPFSGRIHLGDIVALGETGAGAGTNALKFLKDLADQHNVVLAGTAKAYSKEKDHIQDTDRLMQWYLKNGFTRTNGDDIIYKPKRKH